MFSGVQAGHGGGTSSRRGHDGSLSSRSAAEVSGWEEAESIRLRELEEARARAAQMEKTMRWWSDCTANWRDKWSKVRTERNKCREEAKLLRSNLDAALKDLSTYKRDKLELEKGNERMRKELERVHLVLLRHAGQWDPQLLEGLEAGEDGAVSPMASSPVPTLPPVTLSDSDSAPDQPRLDQQLTTLQSKLSDTNRALHLEKLERSKLEGKVEKLEGELCAVRERCEELRAARQEAVRELLEVQDRHADSMAVMTADLVDETNSRQGMDRCIADLRSQLERLQVENANEWGRRERLESDKLMQERENKRLKQELRELTERLERATSATSQTSASLSQLLHKEISDKTKEICELKQSCNKLRRVVGEKSNEVNHVRRRADQYEAEARRLRSRVDELRLELSAALDGLDSANDFTRKLQETKHDYQELIEDLQNQLKQTTNSLNDDLETRDSSSDIRRHQKSSLENQESGEGLMLALKESLDKTAVNELDTPDENSDTRNSSTQQLSESKSNKDNADESLDLLFHNRENTDHFVGCKKKEEFSRIHELELGNS